MNTSVPAASAVTVQVAVMLAEVPVLGVHVATVVLVLLLKVADRVKVVVCPTCKVVFAAVTEKFVINV